MGPLSENSAPPGVPSWLRACFEYRKEIAYENLYNSKSFCLLYLQVRNNQNRSEKRQKFEKKNNLEVVTTFF